MLRVVVTFVLGATLLAVATASAAYLKVDGGTIQVFEMKAPEFHPPIPSECQGKDWSGAQFVVLMPEDNPYRAGNGKEIIFGTSGDDHIYGGNGKDCIVGGDGDDTIEGGNGPDYIDGGGGKNTCKAGRGPATIVNCEKGVGDDPSGQKSSATVPSGGGAGRADPAPSGDVQSPDDTARNTRSSASAVAGEATSARTATPVPTRTPMPTPAPSPTPTPRSANTKNARTSGGHLTPIFNATPPGPHD